jgi:hypothetical protein
MNLGEALRFSYHALASNKIRTFLTALGLVIGNASVILPGPDSRHRVQPDLRQL